MNFFRIFSMVLFFLCSNCFAEDIEVVVFGDEGYPPYAYQEDGVAKGIYTEILKVAFSRMQGYKVVIKTTPWKRGISELEKGTGFALYPPYYSGEKRPFVWPYSLPILDERVVVFCNEDVLAKSLRPNWPEDYYGLKIGNNAGFNVGGDKFWAAVKEGKISVDEAKTTEQNLNKLLLKRIDCYMNDRLSILLEYNRLKKANPEAIQIIEGATISIEQGFIAYTNNGSFPFKEDFVKKFNIVLYEMRRTGELQKIVDDFLKK